MSPERQRIKLAEWAGWTFPCVHCAEHGRPNQWRNPTDTGCVEPSQLPDYLNDLNAVRVLENRLTERQRREYRSLLAESSDLWDADSEQRCAALLVVLGLWEDAE